MRAALVVETAYQLLGIAPDHLDHRALAAPAPVQAGDTHQRAVAVEQRAHLARRQEHVVAAVVGDQETEAVLVADDAAGDQVEPVRQRIAIAPVAHQLAVARHGIQAPAQGLEPVLGVNGEQRGEFLPADRVIDVVDDLEDEFAAGDRTLVTGRLPLCVRVVLAPGGILVTGFTWHGRVHSGRG